MDWNEIFSPKLFLEDMVGHGEIEPEELEDKIYGRVVCTLCHNAVAWMYMRALQDHSYLLDYLFLVTGSYRMCGLAKLDHSWVECREEGQTIMIDLTLAQFRATDKKLYIGEKLKELEEYESVCFADSDKMKELIFSL